ncbi:MAG: hypothetical protein JXA44_10775 [Methanospirillaceae archaeon]|nr:hypothetical protein [Methanospirillaceae archaeon]
MRDNVIRSLKNRRIWISLFFILWSLTLIQGVFAAVTVTGTSVTPEILMPGDTGVVTVTIKNTADLQTGGTVTDFPYIESIYLNGGRDIRVTGGNSRFEGFIGTDQSIDISFLIVAKRTGIFLPELLIRLRNQENIRYPVPVNVNTRIATIKQPALVLSQKPIKDFRPGDDRVIPITIENKGESPARDVTIRLHASGTDIASGRTDAWYVRDLGPEQVYTEEIILLIDPKARPGIHVIPVTITYTRTDGTLETIDTSCSIKIAGDAELALASVGTDPIRPGPDEPFDLIIRIENTGAGDATSVQADVNIPFTGIKTAFLGTIEPDSNAPAVFLLISTGPGTYEYNLRYRYNDDLGTHETEVPLTLVIAPHSDPVLISVLIFGILVLLGAGYLMRKRIFGHA